MNERLLINEVGPRDGLQSQSVHLSSADKLQLIAALGAAGVRSIEAASFVSPKAVPQMADADELFRQLPASDVAYSALVPNVRGLERAHAAGVREIGVVLAATETMNQRNIRLGLDEASRTCRETISAARHLGIRSKAYVAVAFGCPFEGEVPAQRVLELAERLVADGADEIVLADTIGAAAPAAVALLFRSAAARFGAARLSAHFHDTRGFALANAWAAIDVGVRKFDTSIGGLGGCPFAPGAAGNLATEDLVLMAEQCGFATGIDINVLQAARALAEKLLGTRLGGRTSAWLASRQSRPQAAGKVIAELST